MTTEVKFIRENIEVPSSKGYRWTNGYYVCNPITGSKIYPPVLRNAAYKLARELFGADIKVTIE